jgi:hypothetical protein
MPNRCEFARLRRKLQLTYKIALLGLAILMASTAAFAQPYPLPKSIPPEQFDRFFEGKIILIKVDAQEKLREHCSSIFSLDLIACAKRCANCATPTCTIAILEDAPLRAAGLTTQTVMRHEIGHCNGWGSDHQGAREIPANERELREDLMRVRTGH